MTDIQLSRRWKVGSPVSAGGFARVYEATDEDGHVAVIKLIPKAPGAHRELLFEELSGRPNIVPVIDSGETDEHYVLVMPRADRSLRDRLTGGPEVGVDEAVAILTDVAKALAGLGSDVVHRDLKPENILFYEGRWCIADFGIARYAEATTAADTHKFAWTPPYAAPEQWRGERATAATDVYAFGVIAFELIEGNRPFTDTDYRRQHLEDTPASLARCSNAVASLVSECLYKPASARPTAANILARLAKQERATSDALAKLEAVNKSVVEQQARVAADASAERSLGESRKDLFTAANASLARILNGLTDSVLEAAPSTEVTKKADGGLVLRLGDSALIVEPVRAADPGVLAVYDYDPAFDVIAFTSIAAKKPRDRYEYEGRSHSLWFGDAQEEGVYRWYELAFMVMPLIQQRYTMDPFALPPSDENARQCLTPVTTERQVAWQPLAFDQGDEQQFIERWLGWFAGASDGTLSHPSSMPENSGGKFRYPRQRPRHHTPS